MEGDDSGECASSPRAGGRHAIQVRTALTGQHPKPLRTRPTPKSGSRSRKPSFWRGDWIDPDAGKIRFGQYADTWVNDSVLKPRTEELYRGLLKNHLKPAFGETFLSEIREADVRRWRKERLKTGPQQERPFGPVVVAKAYRLLHTIMNTAADDGRIRRNPCRIKGAGQEHSDERPVVPVPVLVE